MSKTIKLMIAALVVIVVLVGVFAVISQVRITKLSKEREELNTKLTTVTDAYNQKIGEAHTLELTARELKLQGDAYKATVETRLKNAGQLEQQTQASKEKYEQEKTKLGTDCTDIDECLKLFCQELRDTKLTLPEYCKQFPAK